MDVDARIQLFDLKTTYAFQTQPGVDRYNMPLYSIQTEPGSQTISFFPAYQGFISPMTINGIQVPLNTEQNSFYNIWPNIVQNNPAVAVGSGATNYTITFPIAPNNSTPITTPIQALLRGHVDIAGITATSSNTDPVFGTTINTSIPTTSIYPAVYFTAQDVNNNSMVVCDSGQFLLSSGSNMPNYGLLLAQGTSANNFNSFLPPFGYTALSGGYTTTLNTINYLTGTANVTFPRAVAAGTNINAQCFYFQTGLPRAALYYNNTLTLRSPPDQQYLVEVTAYLTPAAFLTTGQTAPFGYMCEYIARGAARKILADTGDVEQFAFYEPLFKEQEMLVWKRSQRQWTSSRTQTIYSQGINQGQSGFSNVGGSTF